MDDDHRLALSRALGLAVGRAVLAQSDPVRDRPPGPSSSTQMRTSAPAGSPPCGSCCPRTERRWRQVHEHLRQQVRPRQSRAVGPTASSATGHAAERPSVARPPRGDIFERERRERMPVAGLVRTLSSRLSIRRVRRSVPRCAGDQLPRLFAGISCRLSSKLERCQLRRKQRAELVQMLARIESRARRADSSANLVAHHRLQAVPMLAR